MNNYTFKPHRKFDSETCGIISIILLGGSMFFGVLGIFVYEFVFTSLVTFIIGIAVGIYALCIK